MDNYKVKQTPASCGQFSSRPHSPLFKPKACLFTTFVVFLRPSSPDIRHNHLSLSAVHTLVPHTRFITYPIPLHFFFKKEKQKFICLLSVLLVAVAYPFPLCLERSVIPPVFISALFSCALHHLPLPLVPHCCSYGSHCPYHISGIILLDKDILS
ncbi:hypothetical protein VTN49DRAFT_4843 [Thermomyces lanuginosus]|uniref:uncharacterized protein n=1 Tax=Thermomyces lanuginosus TaxID=5541 RepID=UPI0037446716